MESITVDVPQEGSYIKPKLEFGETSDSSKATEDTGNKRQRLNEQSGDYKENGDGTEVDKPDFVQVTQEPQKLSAASEKEQPASIVTQRTVDGLYKELISKEILCDKLFELYSTGNDSWPVVRGKTFENRIIFNETTHSYVFVVSNSVGEQVLVGDFVISSSNMKTVLNKRKQHPGFSNIETNWDTGANTIKVKQWLQDSLDSNREFNKTSTPKYPSPNESMRAAKYGTFVHWLIFMYFHNERSLKKMKWLIDQMVPEQADDTPRCFVEAVHNMCTGGDRRLITDTELMVGLFESRLAGSVDALHYNEKIGMYSIFDWKTTSNIDMKHFKLVEYDCYFTNGSMPVYTFTDYASNLNLNHKYIVQLATYKYILERNGLKVSDRVYLIYLERNYCARNKCPFIVRVDLQDQQYLGIGLNKAIHNVCRDRMMAINTAYDKRYKHINGF